LHFRGRDVKKSNRQRIVPQVNRKIKIAGGFRPVFD